eukprot:s970_g1.t1
MVVDKLNIVIMAVVTLMMTMSTMMMPMTTMIVATAVMIMMMIVAIVVIFIMIMIINDSPEARDDGDCCFRCGLLFETMMFVVSGAAAALLRRHKESAKLSEEFAEFFFSVQQEAIESLFRCSGTEAAISLSLSLVRQWGVRPLPWMERPLYVVVREAILTCVTPDRSRLPLLDAYTSWIKSEYVRESRCKEIEEELLRQCSTANCEETMPPIARRPLGPRGCDTSLLPESMTRTNPLVASLLEMLVLMFTLQGPNRPLSCHLSASCALKSHDASSVMEAVKAVICVSRYRRKKEDSQVSENGTENHGEVKTEDADANGETPDEERDGDAEAQEDGEEEGEEADEELGALKESQAEEQPEVVTQEPGEEAGEEGEQEGAEEEEACESDPVAMEVADEGEEDAVQALPVGIANASGPIDGEDEECLDEEAMEDDGDVRDIQEIEAMFLADLEDDDDDHVAEVASISAPAWEGAKESLLGEVESDVGPVAAAVRDKVPPWNQPLPAEEAEAVSSDSDEATDEDEEEINLSQYEISDDDDENLEPPVDISDAESDLLDFDDLGDDDWQDDDDWKNYEDESEDDQEDLGPLKHGFTTWLACLAEELPLQLARPQAAKSLRERLLTELREQDGKERLDRHLSVQWEHSLVFEDCPPLLGFTSYQDALCLLRCPALKDLRLVLAWSEKPEEAPTATPSQPRWKTIPPREDRMPKHIPPRERSRSRDRQSLGYFSQPPYREDDRKTKADYRHVHTDQWWTKEFLSIPQENPKVAFDREGVLVVYKPAFWTVTTC